MANDARHIECTMEEYHQRPEWSRSQLEDFFRSPPLFYGRHVAKPPLYPREEKQVFDHGTVAEHARAGRIERHPVDRSRCRQPDVPLVPGRRERLLESRRRECAGALHAGDQRDDKVLGARRLAVRIGEQRRGGRDAVALASPERHTVIWLLAASC